MNETLFLPPERKSTEADTKVAAGGVREGERPPPRPADAKGMNLDSVKPSCPNARGAPDRPALPGKPARRNDMTKDVLARNRAYWEEKVREQNRWTVPVDGEVIAQARRGNWSIILTAVKPVPAHWFPPVQSLRVLCLASGGGQQGPVLAAAGAEVTVLDISEGQLAQDRLVARREGLNLRTVCADMTDLSLFEEERFDLIVHPVSNLFVPDIRPVWREAFRVLKKGGVLMSGFMNPVFYLFDWELEKQGVLQVRHPLPYADTDYLSVEEAAQNSAAVEFGHTLEDQIQGQLEAGFVLTGFYEDTFGGERLLDTFCPSFIATRAVKPQA